MNYLSELTLLFVAVVNSIAIIAYCVRDGKHKKKELISGIATLVAISVFDVAAIVYFFINGMIGNIAVFLLFAPLIGMFLFVNIRDLRK